MSALSLLVVSSLLLFFLPSGTEGIETARPKLVLQITVDQFRGDFPTRCLDRLGNGGLRYLLEQGVYYNNANYLHANTETAVGHATLFTDADPATHGLVGNDWINLSTGEPVYCTEDDRHHLIGKDPKPHQGVSPRNLFVNTIGDELVLSDNGQSRVFSVSVKDRGAIIPGGHQGKAFWYSKRTGEFVTSTYYYEEYPGWVTKWNGAKPADRYKGKTWDLLKDRSTYLAGELDDRPFEVDLRPLGRTFPHQYGETENFYLILAYTPIGDELTLDFTKTLIINEEIGNGEGVDFPAVNS